MKRLVAAILLPISGASLVSAKEKNLVSVRAISHASQMNERTSTYTTPGTSNTYCSGTGTTLGGTTTAAANCQTTSTPAQAHQITSRTLDVVNTVELMFGPNKPSGMQYTISCRASWVGSNCAPMIDGDVFPAEIDGHTMWIIGRKGGNQGKQVRAKYRILDIRPLVHQ